VRQHDRRPKGEGASLSGLKQAMLRTGLEALYFSGSHWWMRPFVGGIGAILTLHHVRPRRRQAFQPNRLLEVTPSYLEAVIVRMRDAGIDLVSLDEMHRQLVEGNFKRRFACLTFDDGYRDNLAYAYPILKKQAAPFAIYVPTSFPDRLGELWWLVLEAVIATNDRIGLVIDDEDRRFDCRTVEQKRELYDALYWWLRGLPTEAVARRLERERGLGPWSVGVVCLEGLGRYDAGLVGDLGLVKLLRDLRGRRVETHETAELVEPYGEWAGLASVYLIAGYARGLVPVRALRAA